MSRNSAQRTLKRILDAVVAATVLIAFSPIIIVVYLAVRWWLGAPALFRQSRPGRGEQSFTILKFRTMTNAGRPDGTLQTDAERLTSLGRFLRRTSLDELPQLWNVLRGEMSLVGPRPMRMDYLPYFTERERLRHTVPPGITGWAQIHGRNEVSWDQRFAYDVWYVEHWSFWLDLKILARTLVHVFGRQNVVVDPRSVMMNLNEERADMVSRAA